MPQSSATTQPLSDVFYPSSDGLPMAETGFHVNAILRLHQALLDHLGPRRPDFYVASDMFLYYEEGKPELRKAPDVMVILGVPPHLRFNFKIWEENAVPQVIFEITSPSTKGEDLVVKRDLYARIGVAEYFLYDPVEEYLDPPLRGFRLEGRKYLALPHDADGALTSQVLGVRMVPEGGMLRLIDAATGEPVTTPTERRFLYEQALRQEARERQRADALQAEVERLRALLGGGSANGPSPTGDGARLPNRRARPGGSRPAGRSG